MPLTKWGSDNTCDIISFNAQVMLLLLHFTALGCASAGGGAELVQEHIRMCTHETHSIANAVSTNVMKRYRPTAHHCHWGNSHLLKMTLSHPRDKAIALAVDHQISEWHWMKGREFFGEIPLPSLPPMNRSANWHYKTFQFVLLTTKVKDVLHKVRHRKQIHSTHP